MNEAQAGSRQSVLVQILVPAVPVLLLPPALNCTTEHQEVTAGSAPQLLFGLLRSRENTSTSLTCYEWATVHEMGIGMTQ